ncbi:MAG: DUF309 domain-containing protein, partial [Roseiflexaceae bacterium]|nr:DUF309 domain-containing protein [Roseiflexaceae bacterium]
HYWHAHEEWETSWRLAQEPIATFYKALIQTAAALVHWQRGNPRGLLRNWHKARPKLVAVLALPCPVDLPRLLNAMDAFVLTQDTLPHAAPPRLVTK